MPLVAIMPVKSFRLGKGRMADSLTVEVRAQLGQRLAERTAGLAIEAGMVPLLVAGDADVATWALTLGLPSIPDTGEGLDAAACSGVDWANRTSSPWLVLHADLPLLTGRELEDLTDAVSDGPVIAPSADGGTSALGGIGAALFSFGPGSFRRHLGRFPGARVITRLGLLHDVDSVHDLESARLHPRGRWLDGIG